MNECTKVLRVKSGVRAGDGKAATMTVTFYCETLKLPPPPPSTK
jgi:hypothetical protein